MHHLPASARPAVLAEMHRVLRPGGRLLIADVQPSTRPAQHLFHGMGSVGAQSRAERRRSHAAGAMAHSSVDQLAPALREAGFRLHRTGEVRSWMHYIAASKSAHR
jgi:ubiquinone/menaquinone biosynthesis C-methylase UbiE